MCVDQLDYDVEIERLHNEIRIAIGFYMWDWIFNLLEQGHYGNVEC